MGIGEIIIGLLSVVLPALVVIALLVSLVRLLNAVEDTAKTLRRIEGLLRERQQGDQTGGADH